MSVDSFAPTRFKNRVPLPSTFAIFAALSSICVLLYIAASLKFAPEREPLFHFGENGAITALSAVFLAMSGALALVVFYLRLQNWSFSNLLWLVLAVACTFLSLDEQLMFHERGGHFIERTSIGEAQFLRNWNDLITLCYYLLGRNMCLKFERRFWLALFWWQGVPLD